MDTMNHNETKSANIKAIYSRRLLERVTSTQVYDRYAQARTLERNQNTKKLFARRYRNLLPATTPLEEYDGTMIGPNKITHEEVELEIEMYGDHVIVTEENELFNLDAVEETYLPILSDQASDTASELFRMALYNGNNVQYADAATSRDDIGTKKITAQDLMVIINKLQHQKAKKIKEVVRGTTTVGTVPIDEAYVAIVHHSMRYQLKDIEGFIPSTMYNDKLPGEFGSFDRIRFVEDLDGRVVEATNGNKILQGIVFGANAYAGLTLRGSENVEMLIKTKKEVGGPLERFSTLGWKMLAGQGILNEAWLVRIETSADIFSTAPKHYYAN